MIGALLLKARQRLRGGVRTSYWREVVRPRILRSPPVAGLTDARCEIHVLTSGKDWLDMTWGLKSFYLASGRRYGLCIHDDGTLAPSQQASLREHFPSARLITRKEADAAVLPTLGRHPRCLEFRKTNHLAPKIFDFAHNLQADRMLLLDSDVLFFAEPTELVRRIEDASYDKNTVNADVASAYTVAPADVERLTGVKLIERFNSGLGLIHKASLNLDWLEEFLGLPGILGHFWRIEQTLFALCSCRWGVELLPPEYDVRLDRQADHGPSRHYVGAIRHFLYRDGVRRLAPALLAGAK